jgi:glycerophosphoryl diester phosphodiesterase
MERTLLYALIIVLFLNCDKKTSKEAFLSQSDNLQPVSLSNQKNKLIKNTMVVAHRGDWRNAPENSLQAVQNCIAMGVDMVEIDLKQTKDSVIVVMHDKTLERTSTGTGLVKDHEYDSIKNLFLKNGYGMPTEQRIPTLEEVLKLCKGKILVFLDKGYPYAPKIMSIAQNLNMQNQLFIEGRHHYQKVKSQYGEILKDRNYMPRVKVNNDTLAFQNYVAPFLKSNVQIFICSVDTAKINDAKSFIQKIKTHNKKIMLTSLWEHTCAGYTDDRAIENPEANWGKIVDLGADLICTDRPLALLNYLRSKNRHQ